ncbi:MAG: flagellar hook-length control protein FliK [Sulfurimonas sp.]|nr:flagellar hook-length control protein FliK [Sulfurimonas sp.]
MINISTNKQLDIILTNTNRALAEVVKNASPKELEVISQNKDLKSIMNSILKESGQSSQADKTLLELVKNNPTLKNLGNVSQTVKELLNTLKLDKNPLPIEKVLKNFLLDIKQLSESVLKQKLENSGIFLESRLKNVQNPQLKLKSALNSLLKNLENSKIFNAKSLTIEIKNLLTTPILRNASNATLIQTPTDSLKVLEQLAKNIDNLINKLQVHLKNPDSTTTKEFSSQLAKLEQQIEPKLLTPENFKLSLMQEILQQLTTQLGESTKTESKGIFDILSRIIDRLKTIQKSSIIPKNTLEQLMDKKLPQELRGAVENIKTLIQKADPIFSKETASIVNKLISLNSPEKLSSQQNIKEVISTDLKAILLKASDEISKSTHPNQTEILKQIDKLALQIDYHQLLSHLSNTSSIYLPFSWEELENGNLNIKKDKEDKFYCNIELKLKKYGKLTLKLVLYDKNQLNLHIYSDNSEFKNIIKEHIGTLRSTLIDAQITPREIRFFETKKSDSTSPYQDISTPIDIGFEVKV